MQRKEIFNISNSLSFIRIFFVLPIYYYISVQQNVIVVLLAVVAFGTDLLDGFLARRLNQVTSFGKMIDPLADKICIGGGLIALSLYQDFPVWISAAIIGRDIALLAGSAWLLGMKKNVISSNKAGKYTVTIIVALAVVYLLNLDVLKWPLTLLAVIMLPYTLIGYGIIMYKVLFKSNAG